MNRILEILNEENYEDIELYANTKEELENKVVEYFQENDEEFTINDVENIAWQGEGLYSISGKALGEIYVELTKNWQQIEFESSTTLQNNFYVIDEAFKVDSDELEILNKFSLKTYGKPCMNEEEYNYRQELKKRYNFSDDLIEKIIKTQTGICSLEKDVINEDFYDEYKNYIYLGYEPNWSYYYFLNKDLKTLYYIRSYYDRNSVELK